MGLPGGLGAEGKFCDKIATAKKNSQTGVKITRNSPISNKEPAFLRLSCGPLGEVPCGPLGEALRSVGGGLPIPAQMDFSFEHASWGSSVSSGRNSQKLGKARSFLEF